VVRAIVFQEAEASRGTTSARWMALARKYMAGVLPNARFVGGTNGNFAELNRQPPDISGMDGVSYPINPQVHAFDERSLVEAIEAQRDTVLTARSYCGTLPISISSVTLKPPFNQAATEAEEPRDPNELPANVDPRQMSLFAAAWTVGSIRSLASGGADSITYYETTGWRGLMETEGGSPLPEKFCSIPGMVYPLYWIFAFLAEAKGAVLLQSLSNRPLLVDGLALKKDNRIWLLVSNYQPYDQEMRLSSLSEGRASMRRLNEDTIGLAALTPKSFQAMSEPVNIDKGDVALTLKPYETSMIEVQLSG